MTHTKQRLIDTAKYLILTVILCCGFLPQISDAHTLFLQSSRYTLNQGKSSPLFFCYGHYIPVADGVRGKKLNNITITRPDGAIHQPAIRNETGLHSYPVSYDMPGIWMLTAETNPGFYTVYIDKKGRERHVIKPMSKVRDRAEKIITSLYSKQYTKTYVACDTSSGKDFQRAGLDLELVPVNDLFSLKPGGTLELDVFHNGQPYEGEGTWDATYSGFSTLSEDFFHPRTKTTGSRVSIPVPTAGRWFVRYFIKIDAPESERENYRQLKQTATLVFQIDNKRKTPKETH